MDRFLLDIENLPKAKKEVILQITSTYPDKRKVAFIKSLIFLGFSTIKQADIDIATANIGKSSNDEAKKYRIILTNTPIADFLKNIKNQTTKRSCVYAFLYAGIASYIDFMTVIHSHSADKKVLENIEKKLFLCGLGEHLNTNLSINIQITPPSPPSSSTTLNNQLDIPKQIEKNNSAPRQNEITTNFTPGIPLTEVNKETPNANHIAKKSPKPKFKIDGV